MLPNGSDTIPIKVVKSSDMEGNLIPGISSGTQDPLPCTKMLENKGWNVERCSMTLIIASIQRFVY